MEGIFLNYDTSSHVHLYFGNASCNCNVLAAIDLAET